MNLWHDLDSLPPFYMKEVTHFFSVYKDLEGINTEAKGWDGREAAWERINYAIDLYQKKIANGKR
jgi:inorganic pyrophosphatase